MGFIVFVVRIGSLGLIYVSTHVFAISGLDAAGNKLADIAIVSKTSSAHQITLADIQPCHKFHATLLHVHPGDL